MVTLHWHVTEFCVCKFIVVVYTALLSKHSSVNGNFTKTCSWAVTEAGNVEDANEWLWRRERKRLIDSNHDVVKQLWIDGLRQSISRILSLTRLQLNSV